MELAYSPNFLKNLKKLPPSLQDEAIEKMELLKVIANHKRLKVHKLMGRLSAQYSFSVNHKTRILFVYLPTRPKTAYLTAIGDHDVYDT